MDDSALKQWLRRLKWTAIAIFGSEIVVYAAFEQWLFAKQFLKELNEVARESNDEKFKVRYTRGMIDSC